MKVRNILASTGRRLAILSWDAPVISAAVILARPDIPLVVVCDRMGVAIGVITRIDLIRQLTSGSEAALAVSAGAVMTQPVFACGENESLDCVWDELKARKLKCAPVLDDQRRPMGLIHAREIARALLGRRAAGPPSGGGGDEVRDRVADSALRGARAGW